VYLHEYEGGEYEEYTKEIDEEDPSGPTTGVFPQEISPSSEIWHIKSHRVLVFQQHFASPEMSLEEDLIMAHSNEWRRKGEAAHIFM
jgi:hypothetical protein